ncbi:MAG: tol-pal system protein YbgF [Burkholderiales bacterium]
MRNRLAGAALAASLLLAHGPAAAIFDDDVARGMIRELSNKLDATSKALDERLSRVEDRRALVEISAQIESLRVEISRLRGQLEVIQNQVDTADKRSKDLYVDIDTRLRKIEQVKEGAPPSADGKAAPDAAVPAPEAKAYEAALNQFKLGNYPLAIAAFQGFLVTYPTSRLAPSAQYWIGNAHFAQRDYKQAIAAQQRVLASWPDDPKAADAMLNIASAQEAMGDRRGGQKTLEALLARYPQSPAAASAKQRMSPQSAAPSQPAGKKQ